jgi:hypothetical protein
MRTLSQVYMPKNYRPARPEAALSELLALLNEFPESLQKGTVGEQVCRLVEIHHRLRDLGVSVVAPLLERDADSGRARLLAYLLSQVGRIVHTDELMIVAAITDYQRRIRELRVSGWPIISGAAVSDMRSDARATAAVGERVPGDMAPEEYVLLEPTIDLDAARRWTLAGAIRKKKAPLKESVLEYLLAAVGKRVTAEELRHAGGDDSGWPAAVRELQSDGWKIQRELGKCVGLPGGIFIMTSAVQ